MLKVLIIVLALVALLWLLFGRSARKGEAPKDTRRGRRGGVEDMVVCAHCGVHLPRSEALAARGLHYCSAAHRDTKTSAPD